MGNRRKKRFKRGPTINIRKEYNRKIPVRDSGRLTGSMTPDHIALFGGK